MFSNIKIGKKLAIGFGVVLAFTLIISTLSVVVMLMMSTNTTSTFDNRVKPLEILDSINESYERTRGNALMVLVSRNDKNHFQQAISEYNDAKTYLIKNIKEYSNFLNNWDGSTTEGLALIKEVDRSINEYITTVTDKVVELAQGTEEQASEAQQLLSDNNMIDLGTYASSEAKMLFSFNIDKATEADEANQASANNAIYAVIIVVIISMLLGIILAVIITKNITTPVKSLTDILSKVTVGNLDVNATSNARDELGVLTRNVGEVVHSVRSLVTDMSAVSDDFSKGEIESKIDETKFKGSFMDVASEYNTTVNSIVQEALDFISCMTSFSEGNFDADIPKLPGKKAVMNTSRDNLRTNLMGVNKDISLLVTDAIDGKLDSRIDSSKYRGDWGKLATSLNDLMIAVSTPITEASFALSELSKGNLEARMSGNYKGEFAKIKQSLNSTMESVALYIHEIADILTAVAENHNLDQEITREYVGEFNSIKSSINLILESLSKVMRDITSASEQVNSGARIIADSSVSLAQGASEQASAVEELNASIDTINEQIMKSSTDAQEVNQLSLRSKENAAIGNTEMHNMLQSMEDIKVSSDNISKINKVIEDIAFQTNLLALNAAVEAARAGEHGKGFAVVAEEVRNLAAKSQDASKETTTLIEDSIKKVDEGTVIARATAESLQTIVNDFERVSSIISNIADSSADQANSISQISIGIGQISQVVQNNSSTSEESAATSEELSSQSETLRSMISVFELKNI